jgi:hypothetical protein
VPPVGPDHDASAHRLLARGRRQLCADNATILPQHLAEAGAIEEVDARSAACPVHEEVVEWFPAHG